MAAKMYKMKVGEVKTNAVASALTGAETITASVAANEIAIIIDSGTVGENSNIVTNSINNLRDLLMEANKA